jgi:GTP diphosphokinase / guanosine-3',5'-bis(diphosphate) 3'-diphosphatase
LFYRVAKGIIDLRHIKKFQKQKEKGTLKKESPAKKKSPNFEELVTSIRGSSDMLVIGENLKKIDYKLSPCCNPIPGDDVFGFITINDGIKIHRVNCPNAIELMSNYAYRIVKARWTNQEAISFLAGLKVNGIDEVGIVNKITQIISSELNVNMRSISFDTNDGIFEGNIMVFVQDTHHLTELISKLKKVEGVLSVTRVDGK